MCSERVIGAFPMTVRRRVKWGECDPAGVVYTPRFAEYVTNTFHLFLEQLLGDPLQQKLRELDIGTPAKAMSIEFKRSLWPDQVFDMTVRVSAIRTGLSTWPCRQRISNATTCSPRALPRSAWGTT